MVRCFIHARIQPIAGLRNHGFQRLLDLFESAAGSAPDRLRIRSGVIQIESLQYTKFGLAEPVRHALDTLITDNLILGCDR